MPIIHSMIPGHTGTFTIENGQMGYLAGHMNMSTHALDAQPWTIVTIEGSTTHANVALYPNGNAPDGVVLYRHLSEIRDLPPEFSLVLEPIPANTTTTELPFIAGMTPTPIEPPSPAPTNPTIEGAPQRVANTPDTTNLTRTNIPQPPRTTPEPTAEEELPIPTFLQRNTDNVTHIPDIQATPMPENIPGLIGMTVNIPGHEGVYYSGNEDLGDIISAAGIPTTTLNSHPWSIIRADGEEKYWIFSDLIERIHAARQISHGVDTIDQMMAQGYQIYDHLEEAINNDIIRQGDILTLNTIPDIDATPINPTVAPTNPTTIDTTTTNIPEVHGVIGVTLVTPDASDTYYLTGNTLSDLFLAIDAETIEERINAEIEDCIIKVTDAHNRSTRYGHIDYMRHHRQRHTINEAYEDTEEFEEQHILSHNYTIEFIPPTASAAPQSVVVPTNPSPTITSRPTTPTLEDIPEINGLTGVKFCVPGLESTYYLNNDKLTSLFEVIERRTVESTLGVNLHNCIFNITDADGTNRQYCSNNDQATHDNLGYFTEEDTLSHNCSICITPRPVQPTTNTAPGLAPVANTILPDYIPGLMAITVELPGYQGTYYVTQGRFSEFLRESDLTMDRLQQFAWTITYPDGVTKVGHQIINTEENPDGAIDLNQHGITIREAPIVAS